QERETVQMETRTSNQEAWAALSLEPCAPLPENLGPNPLQDHPLLAKKKMNLQREREVGRLTRESLLSPQIRSPFLSQPRQVLRCEQPLKKMTCYWRPRDNLCRAASSHVVRLPTQVRDHCRAFAPRARA